MATILTICPYKLFPLRGGGSIRCFHLLRQLARFHEVHAIVFQRASELARGSDGYEIPGSVSLYNPPDVDPPPTFFDKLPARLGRGLHYRWLRRSWRGPADRILLRSYHFLERILMERRVDAVVFEHASTLPAAPLVRRLSSGTFRILDAHNVDHELLAQQIRRRNGGKAALRERRLLQNLKCVERRLRRFVDMVWTCSEEDRIELLKHNDIAILTIPNGVDTKTLAFDDDAAKFRRKEILFCGSLSYEPNIDGIEWFHTEVWPLIKQSEADVEFTVVGRDGDRNRFPGLSSDPKVNFVGEVPDVRSYYKRAALAVVPLRMGSGTRLKIPEAMSLGAPVVSTTIGAQGIQAENGREILIADEPEKFADAVRRLLSDRDLFERLRHSARTLVERKYDWDVVGNTANEVLTQALSTTKKENETADLSRRSFPTKADGRR